MGKNKLNTQPPDRVANASTFEWEKNREAYYKRLHTQMEACDKLGIPEDQRDKDVRWYKTRVQEGEAAARKALEAEKASKLPPRPEKPMEDRKPGGKRYDRDAMVKMYIDQNMTIGMIAKVLGCSTATVVNGLRAKDVYQSGRDMGRSNDRFDLVANKITNPRRKVCVKGLHDMEKYGRVINKRGKPAGRYCYACLRIKRGISADLFEEVTQDGES